MVKDDKYSDKEFDSKEDMHLYWAENLMDELSSHDKDKAKKALRKKEEVKSQKMQWRKKMMMRGIGGLVMVALVYVSAPAIVSVFSGGASIDYADLDLENQPMLGDADAEITVVEFGDYLCPACKSFEDTVKPQLMQHIENGDVNLHYIDFPLPSFNPSNTQASVAAQCVYNQDEDQFWNMHDALYDNQQQMGYDDSSLVQLAEQNTEGLDYDRLEQCIEDQETIDAVNSDRQLGQENSVRSTPTLFVNGDRVTSQKNLVSVVEDRLE